MVDIEEQKRKMTKRLQYYEDVLSRRPDGYKRMKLRYSIPNTRRALMKIEEGTYEFCDSCGSRIDERRLLAVPAALRCRDCQEDVEVR